MNTDALITAVQGYFAGERHEGFAILGFLVALVLVIAQLVIDHYSEARAVRYGGELNAAVSVATRGLMP